MHNGQVAGQILVGIAQETSQRRQARREGGAEAAAQARGKQLLWCKLFITLILSYLPGVVGEGQIRERPEGADGPALLPDPLAEGQGEKSAEGHCRSGTGAGGRNQGQARHDRPCRDGRERRDGLCLRIHWQLTHSQILRISYMSNIVIFSFYPVILPLHVSVISLHCMFQLFH